MSDVERSKVVREICATPGVLSEEQRTRLLRALLPGREVWICTVGRDYGHTMAWHTEGVYVDLLDARTLVVGEEHRRVHPARAKHDYDVDEPGEVWVDDESEDERTFTPWKVEAASQRFRDEWKHEDVCLYPEGASDARDCLALQLDVPVNEIDGDPEHHGCPCRCHT